MFGNAKVGQRVWSYTYGWGNIVDNDKTKLVLCVDVIFETGVNMQYDVEGFSLDALNQDLFYDEIKVEIPKSAKKPKVEWKFPCYGVDKNGTIVYFRSESNGVIISTRHEDSVLKEESHIAMCYFTPCTLEAKEPNNV